MARPTKLTESLLIAAQEYVKSGWRDKRHAVPMIEGLALHIGVDRETVRAWANEAITQNKTETAAQFKVRTDRHDRFSGIVKELNSIQALELASGALKNKLNARTANMMLSKHGYVERKDITSDDKPLAGATIVFDDDPTSND